jgi:hypothetical protein
MPSTNTAIAIMLVGLVLVPGPAYAVAVEQLAGEDRHRSAAGYRADSINATNDTLLAERYAGRLTEQPEDIQARHVRGNYEIPNRTRAVLDRAIENDSATTHSDAVSADLYTLARNATFLTHEFDTYYTFRITRDDNGTTTVRTDRASDAEIAAAVRDQFVVEYTALTDAEQRTFQKIRNATTDPDDYAYRPYQDEPVPPEPVVERNGTHYAVGVASHTDDFDFPTGFLAGLAASGIGITCILVGGGISTWNLIRG